MPDLVQTVVVPRGDYDNGAVWSRLAASNAAAVAVTAGPSVSAFTSTFLPPARPRLDVRVHDTPPDKSPTVRLEANRDIIAWGPVMEFQSQADRPWARPVLEPRRHTSPDDAPRIFTQANRDIITWGPVIEFQSQSDRPPARTPLDVRRHMPPDDAPRIYIQANRDITAWGPVIEFQSQADRVAARLGRAVTYQTWPDDTPWIFPRTQASFDPALGPAFAFQLGSVFPRAAEVIMLLTGRLGGSAGPAPEPPIDPSLVPAFLVFAERVGPRRGMDERYQVGRFMASSIFDAALYPAIDDATQGFMAERRRRLDPRWQTLPDTGYLTPTLPVTFDVTLWPGIEAELRTFRMPERAKLDARFYPPPSDAPIIFTAVPPLNVPAVYAAIQDFLDAFRVGPRMQRHAGYDTTPDAAPVIFTGVPPLNVAAVYAAVQDFLNAYRVGSRAFQRHSGYHTRFDESSWITPNLPTPPSPVPGVHDLWAMYLRRLALFGQRRWS